MSIYVGIDPGMAKGKLGLVILHQKKLKRYVQLGTKLEKGAIGIASDFNRANILAERLVFFLNDTFEPSKNRKNMWAAVEGPAFARKQPRTIQTGFVHYVIYEALATIHTLKVLTVPPKTLTKFVTGNGNDNKNAVCEMVHNRWKDSREYSSENLLEARALAAFARAFRRGLVLSTKPPEIHRVERGVYYLAK